MGAVKRNQSISVLGHKIKPKELYGVQKEQLSIIGPKKYTPIIWRDGLTVSMWTFMSITEL